MFLFGKDRTLVPRIGLQKRRGRVAIFEATLPKLPGLNLWQHNGTAVNWSVKIAVANYIRNPTTRLLRPAL